MNTLEKNIKELLEKKSMTQVELAKKLNKKKQYITQVLDRGTCNTKLLMEICSILKCTPNQLLLERA